MCAILALEKSIKIKFLSYLTTNYHVKHKRKLTCIRIKLTKESKRECNIMQCILRIEKDEKLPAVDSSLSSFNDATCSACSSNNLSVESYYLFVLWWLFVNSRHPFIMQWMVKMKLSVFSERQIFSLDNCHHTSPVHMDAKNENAIVRTHY